MTYAAIDTETTGLNPEKHKILEIGVVIDDCENPVEELRKERIVLNHPLPIEGHPKALEMNKGLIEEIQEGQSDDLYKPEWAAAALAVLFDDVKQPITLAGKNVGSFDLRFLERLDHFKDLLTVRRRVLDPSVLFWNPTIDDRPPDLKTCKQRAGFNATDVTHNAMQDALDVVRLLRKAK